MPPSRKRLFLHHFIAGTRGVRGHKRKAAIAAGYKDSHTLDTTIQGISRDPEIQAALKAHFERVDLTDERIIAEYCRIAFASIGDVFTTVNGDLVLDNLDTLSPDVLAAVAEIKPVIHQETGALHWGVKMHDKKSALDFLAKLRGLIRAPDINITLIQLMANLNLAAYTTEELRTFQALIQRGMPGRALPGPPEATPEAKNITPRPDLPQNGSGH